MPFVARLAAAGPKPSWSSLEACGGLASSPQAVVPNDEAFARAASRQLQHAMPKGAVQLSPELEAQLRELFGKMDRDNDTILSKARHWGATRNLRGRGTGATAPLTHLRPPTWRGLRVRR